MTTTSLSVINVEFIPHDLEEGFIYVSNKYHTAVHLCPCGCGNEVVTPVNIDINGIGWEMVQSNESVTLKPSIYSKILPCKSHYFIRNNLIVWVL